jgi:hypothetical protein
MTDDLNRIEAALIRALRPPLNSKGANGTMKTSFGNTEADTEIVAVLTNPPAAEANLATNPGIVEITCDA